MQENFNKAGTEFSTDKAEAPGTDKCLDCSNMADWYKIQIPCSTLDENNNVIKSVISPVIKDLENEGKLVNFFILNEPKDKDNPQRVMFIFYGDKTRVEGKLKKIKGDLKFYTEPYDPKSEQYRFGEDYMLGIRMFELGSRFALCEIAGKKPVDKSSGSPLPIILTLRHGYCNNLLINDGRLPFPDKVTELDKSLIRAYNLLL